MRSASLVALALLGCGSSASPAGDVEHAAEETTVFCLDGPRKIDILFVVDDSASMADEAARVAETAARLGAVLDAERYRYDVTVHVTHTEAEACTDAFGALVDTSCRDRRETFASNGGDGALAADVWEVGCAAQCDATAMEDSFASRLACLLPAGIDACDDESPLSAMLAAILRSTDDEDAATGWMRDDASLLAVLLTDEDEPDDAQVLDTAASLRELREAKQAVDPDNTVALAIAAGWNSDDEPTGCSSPGQQASAPTRLDVLRRAAGDLVAETTSICGDDVTVLFAPIAEHLVYELRPLCISPCVALDEAADGERTAACHATRRNEDGSTSDLPRCDGDASSWRVPADADHCIAFAQDTELDYACAEAGANVEAVIVAREGAPPPARSCIEVTCAVSDAPLLDCPSRE